MTQATFKQGQSQVAELVKRFSPNAAAYHSPTYNEAQARIQVYYALFVQQIINGDISEL